ncbi:hypothetical protein BO70DRAFT_433219 [Aspergillus heteromorphus CBS 117.55]|uniref:RecA family profile 1 domain-containing protein n=1 Tax=Aspergillus heteromorphus CBS 117.55 TaxID=1448321 RepID=A0A317UVC1_9EURO|nr:uncharacterized protein BO70DRAFT_433219 [Aspergillus heteromorphus CBS 117.55]PWY65964.1 hypothetical protein BO70DRAFT_433219 [Aspergillus heteromorphus CBS 117.55]
MHRLEIPGLSSQNPDAPRVFSFPASQALHASTAFAASGTTALSTGLPALDQAFTDGLDLGDGESKGLPLGRVTEIFGPPGAGKTSLALSAAATALRNGDQVVWIDKYLLTRKWNVISDLATKLVSLAHANHIAVLVINQTHTRIRGQVRATLCPILGAGGGRVPCGEGWGFMGILSIRGRRDGLKAIERGVEVGDGGGRSPEGQVQIQVQEVLGQEEVPLGEKELQEQDDFQEQGQLQQQGDIQEQEGLQQQEVPQEDLQQYAPEKDAQDQDQDPQPQAAQLPAPQYPEPDSHPRHHPHQTEPETPHRKRKAAEIADSQDEESDGEFDCDETGL